MATTRPNPSPTTPAPPPADAPPAPPTSLPTARLPAVGPFRADAARAPHRAFGGRASGDPESDTGGAEVAGLTRLTPSISTGGRGIPRGPRRLAGPLVLLAVWWLGSAQGLIPASILPSPTTVASTFGDLIVNGQLPKAMGVSLQRVAIGVAIGLFCGGGPALIAGLFRLGEDLIDAPMQMIRTLPWAGLIPLLIIWLGIDELPKVALVSLAVALPLYINTYAGIRNVDNSLVEVARTLRLSRLGLIRHVVLPGALPNSLIGLRWALGSAWLALVFAEQVNARAGIGYLITSAREVYRVDIIIVALVVYACLGLAADAIVRLLEKGLLAWRPSFQGT
jgi:sulfonate transport system permease protein